MSAAAKPDGAASAPAEIVIAEVKYSLPQLLLELKAERTGGAFAMEKLDQNEIGKLFKANAARRPKPKG
ncbi:MAG: hypothetical protein RLZZ15_3010 [Verrucomicrobiota bacterium]|jgi:hypothetical protein